MRAYLKHTIWICIAGALCIGHFRPNDVRESKASSPNETTARDGAPALDATGRGGSIGAWSYPIQDNNDDGTEINESEWLPDGFYLTQKSNYYNKFGRDVGDTYTAGLRFHVEGLFQGQSVVYARLRIPTWGGTVTTGAKLMIEGILQASPTAFADDDRPSQKLPKTIVQIPWEINEAWQTGHDLTPLYYYSPPITDIVNEILAQADWGTGPEGATLALTIRDDGSDPNSENALWFEDSHSPDSNTVSTPAVLDVYPEIEDALVGKEILGRPTDTEITVNLYPLINMDFYVEYGKESGAYNHTTTPVLDHPGEEGLDILLDGLEGDTQYYYRLAYRKAGEGEYEFGAEHSFHTARPSGTSFSFAITADEHWPHKYPIEEERMALYEVALENVKARSPDFHISMGDFAILDNSGSKWTRTHDEAEFRYSRARQPLNGTSHSLPFFLVVGNHEGEQGWRYDFDNPGGNMDSKPMMAALARLEFLPNPQPNEFYTGDIEPVAECGLRENYYAWEWGDALFVVLDPYWYSKNSPQWTYDNWQWTLGQQQYDWLYETLHGTNAKWKFVFMHNLTSSRTYGDGSHYYGRGGIEIAKYKVDNAPSFEWGGEDEDGIVVFDEKRPGWSHGPIHDMLAEANVDVIFHGHDHVFARQTLDGMIYQECPRPNDETYSYGHMEKSGYEHGLMLQNSGHLHVTVQEEYVLVEYVLSYLPGDGENGAIGCTYYIGLRGDLDYDGDVDLSDLATLLAAYGRDYTGDIDKDGDTDNTDLRELLVNYGVCYR